MNRLGSLSVWLCLAGLVAIALVQGHLTALQLSMVVVTTAFGAMLLCLWSCGPLSTLRAGWHAVAHRWHRDDGNRLFDRIVTWSAEVRQNDLSILNSFRRRERNRFARNSLGLLDQHTNPVTLRLALERQIRSDEDAALTSARVFDNMAANAWVVGLVTGCVSLFVIIGRSAMAPESWSAGGLAFGIAVISGVLMSGSLFRPLAKRLRARGVRRGNDQARGMNGLLALWQRKHPQRVRVALYGDRCAVEV